MPGSFALKTPQDLLRKLHHDPHRLMREPADACTAFDFFVTALHLPDWLYPGDAPKRQQLFAHHLLLQVCRHLAEGSTHFEVVPKCRPAVTDTSRAAGALPPGAFQTTGFSGGYLIVTLDGAAAAQFGTTMTVTTLATHILTFWETHPDLR